MKLRIKSADDASYITRELPASLEADSFWLRFVLTTGGAPGPADDTLILAANSLPTNCYVADMFTKVSNGSGNPGDSVQIKAVTGAGGTIYAECEADSGGLRRNINGQDNIFPAASNMYARRSDAVIGGIIYVLLFKT